MAMDLNTCFIVLKGCLMLAWSVSLFRFLFVNMFDTAGTLMGVADKADLVNEKGEIENLKKSLKADSVSSVLGACVGCPPVNVLC